MHNEAMALQAPRWCRGHYCPFIGQSRYDDYCCGRCDLALVAGGPAGHGSSCSLKVLDAEMWASGSLHGSAAGSAKGDQLEGEDQQEETLLEGEGELVIEEAKSADPRAKKSRQ